MSASFFPTLLYAMAPRKHSILMIDTAQKRQVSILEVGGMPALALVALLSWVTASLPGVLTPLWRSCYVGVS
jgi:hypothetical protein